MAAPASPPPGTVGRWLARRTNDCERLAAARLAAADPGPERRDRAIQSLAGQRCGHGVFAGRRTIHEKRLGAGRDGCRCHHSGADHPSATRLATTAAKHPGRAGDLQPTIGYVGRVMDVIDLYYSPVSGNSSRVVFALHEGKIPFTPHA